MSEESQTQSDILLYEEKKGVAYITINRPDARNSLNAEILERIPKLMKEVDENRKIKVVVFRSTGDKAFSGGLDLKWVTSLGGNAISIVWSKATAVSEAIIKSPKIIISSVQASAVGWGTILFLNSDFRIVADKPDIFFQLPEVDVGIPAATGATLSPIIHLGLEKAKRMLLLCEKVNIDFMRDIITKVVPADKLIEETDNFAKLIAKHPNSHLMHLTKAAMNVMGQNLVEKFFAIEKECLDYAILAEKPKISDFTNELWKKYGNFGPMKLD